MREKVIHRATQHAEDARLFSLLKTREGAITNPVVDRANRSNAQNSVMPRDRKVTGNEIRDCYEQPQPSWGASSMLLEEVSMSIYILHSF